MNDPWSTLEALITVRTYPAPSGQSIESSCTAGVTRDGQWVRLYPVPYRLLDSEKRFRKWQWVRVRVRRATTDPRVESRRIDETSIEIASDVLSTDTQWLARRQVITGLEAPSMCWLQSENKRSRTKQPTLGFVRPREVTRFRVVPEKNPEWNESELTKLRQSSMFRQPPAQQLEKIPYKFVFRYLCMDQGCHGHGMMCSDWELAELYRNVRSRADWEQQIEQRIDWMIRERDLGFFVGTLSDYPSKWIIIGLWYPPREQQGALL